MKTVMTHQARRPRMEAAGDRPTITPGNHERIAHPGPETSPPQRHGRQAAPPIPAASSRIDRDRINDTWRKYKIQPSRRLRDELVEHYMSRHVRLIAERLRASLPPSIDIDDLTQQGYLGLVRSIERYQLDRGTRFETFSSLRILGAMRDWLREQDHIPRQVRQRARLNAAVMEQFRVRHGRAPEPVELMELLDLPLEDALFCLAHRQPPAMVTFSTVTSTADQENQELSDLAGLSDENPSASPFHQLSRDDLRRWLVRELDDRDQMIVVLYYYEDLTMREIGHTLGCSESRVSQRLNSILLRLRAKLVATQTSNQQSMLD